MVVDPEPADLVLEMRAVKFMLDYDGAKEAEYRRLRRAESQMGKTFRRSWLRRTAESLGFGNQTDHDRQPPQDEIDVCVPPFFSISICSLPGLSSFPSTVNALSGGTRRSLPKGQHIAQGGGGSVSKFQKICGAHRGWEWKVIPRLQVHRRANPSTPSA
jgi:hypothetical protein